MPPAIPKPLNSTAILCAALLATYFTFSSAEALVVQVNDAAKRRRLARTYAPEIHQDKAEIYGLASIAYFLRRSELRAVISGCPLLKKRFTSVVIGNGMSLASPPQGGRLTWRHQKGICQRGFRLFHNQKYTHKELTYQPATNRVFLQLQDHKADTLLKGPHKHAITPVVSYHIHEIQYSSCTQRNLFFSCQRYQTHRYYVIQYFVTLMFNEACNEHEGEHEGLVVLVNANDFDFAKHTIDRYKAIVKVGMFGHYHTKLYDPSQMSFAGKDLTHPIAYMGRGGHALYPKSGSTNLLLTYPRELRSPMRRTCTKRKRFSRLTEHHRGGGSVYKTWLPPKGKQVITTAAFWRNKRAHKTGVKQPGLTAQCILARRQAGVRLCDTKTNRHDSPCCLKGSVRGALPWIQFTGRWGKQEAFASSIAGAAAAQVGRVLRRWPLARSMGNSGPFGPQWIHASTWRWRNAPKAPAATSALWR